MSIREAQPVSWRSLKFRRGAGADLRNQVLLKCAGTNATKQFDAVHAPGILEENLSADKFKGTFHEASSDVPPTGTACEAQEKNEATQSDDEPGHPELHTLISAADFEKVASKALTPKTWAFYSSAATDLVTHGQNKSLLRRIMIQPRILRNVKTVNFRRRILGYDSSAPFFISPAAMARLAHPDGELALAKAACSEDIIQCVRGQFRATKSRPPITSKLTTTYRSPTTRRSRSAASSSRATRSSRTSSSCTSTRSGTRRRSCWARRGSWASRPSS
jgi:hypothetical protein